MLFILTNSEDATTDMVVERLPGLSVFRFNIDRWKEYRWSINSDGFEFSHGDFSCTSADLRLLYVRKAMHWDRIDVPKEGSLEHWCREEIDAVIQGLIAHCHALNKLTLVHGGNGRWPKVRQMWVAQKYFNVPRWAMVRGDKSKLPPAPLVVKANTGTLVGGSTIMTVREVAQESLDPQYPWFLQKKVDADADVTVAYVRGELFAYELDRSLFSGVDCRMPTAQAGLVWHPCQLGAAQEVAIRDFMKETGFSFGRLDFLRSGDELHFLEINPNGMWAWLDPDGDNGLLAAVASVIRDDYENATQGMNPFSHPPLLQS